VRKNVLSSAGLSNLISDLASDETHPFHILDQVSLYPAGERELKKLLLRKGVYPYEFVTSLDVLREARQMVKKEDFFSTLKNEGINSEEYELAKEVFEKFECVDMLEYTGRNTHIIWVCLRLGSVSNLFFLSEIYVLTDAALLMECLLVFREEIFSSFKLDICHYLSTAQLALDAFLLSTGIEIELLTCSEMYLFFEQSIRGGIFFLTFTLIATNYFFFFQVSPS
jgi:hypothetical protein